MSYCLLPHPHVSSLLACALALTLAFAPASLGQDRPRTAYRTGPPTNPSYTQSLSAGLPLAIGSDFRTTRTDLKKDFGMSVGGGSRLLFSNRTLGLGARVGLFVLRGNGEGTRTFKQAGAHLTPHIAVTPFHVGTTDVGFRFGSGPTAQVSWFRGAGSGVSELDYGLEIAVGTELTHWQSKTKAIRVGLDLRLVARDVDDIYYPPTHGPGPNIYSPVGLLYGVVPHIRIGLIQAR